MKERIRELRKALSLSQAEFGKRLGVSRDVIVNLELGRVQPRRLLLLHICDVFHVNGNWLFRGEGDMFSAPQESGFPISLLTEKYKLTEQDLSILSDYMKLDPEQRGVVVRLMELLAGNPPPSGGKRGLPPSSP